MSKEDTVNTWDELLAKALRGLGEEVAAAQARVAALEQATLVDVTPSPLVQQVMGHSLDETEEQVLPAVEAVAPVAETPASPEPAELSSVVEAAVPLPAVVAEAPALPIAPFVHSNGHNRRHGLTLRQAWGEEE